MNNSTNILGFNQRAIDNASHTFGCLNSAITWDLLESTKNMTNSKTYSDFIDDLLTNQSNDIDNPEILPSCYLFASIEDFEINPNNSHLNIMLIKKVTSLVNIRLSEFKAEIKKVERIAIKLVKMFSNQDNQEQSVMTWIWNSAEYSDQYITLLRLIDIVDSSFQHQKACDLVKNYIPSFNY